MRETLYRLPGLLCDATIWAPRIAAHGDVATKVPAVPSPALRSPLNGLARRPGPGAIGARATVQPPSNGIA